MLAAWTIGPEITSPELTEMLEVCDGPPVMPELRKQGQGSFGASWLSRPCIGEFCLSVQLRDLALQTRWSVVEEDFLYLFGLYIHMHTCAHAHVIHIDWRETDRDMHTITHRHINYICMKKIM